MWVFTHGGRIFCEAFVLTAFYEIIRFKFLAVNVEIFSWHVSKLTYKRLENYCEGWLRSVFIILFFQIIWVADNNNLVSPAIPRGIKIAKIITDNIGKIRYQMDRSPIWHIKAVY